ncbi:DUF309 domain-containing protein [Arenibacterium sp. CAU 1754]
MKSPDDFSFPAHAYVPGLTARHPEGAFAALHDSVEPGMDVAALARTRAWRAGCALLQNGYFWEAHEALEPVWMQAPPNSVERQFVQGVIQTANAALKSKMGRPRAVLRLCDMAEQHLDSCGAVDQVMGLALCDVRDMLENLRRFANLDGPETGE